MLLANNPGYVPCSGRPLIPLERYRSKYALVPDEGQIQNAVEQQSLEAIIVEVADAISGARPGARRENVETFLKRVHDLEDIAKSQAGVEEADGQRVPAVLHDGPRHHADRAGVHGPPRGAARGPGRAEEPAAPPATACFGPMNLRRNRALCR